MKHVFIIIILVARVSLLHTASNIECVKVFNTDARVQSLLEGVELQTSRFKIFIDHIIAIRNSGMKENWDELVPVNFHPNEKKYPYDLYCHVQPTPFIEENIRLQGFNMDVWLLIKHAGRKKNGKKVGISKKLIDANRGFPGFFIANRVSGGQGELYTYGNSLMIVEIYKSLGEKKGLYNPEDLPKYPHGVKYSFKFNASGKKNYPKKDDSLYLAPAEAMASGSYFVINDPRLIRRFRYPNIEDLLRNNFWIGRQFSGDIEHEILSEDYALGWILDDQTIKSSIDDLLLFLNSPDISAQDLIKNYNRFSNILKELLAFTDVYRLFPETQVLSKNAIEKIKVFQKKFGFEKIDKNSTEALRAFRRKLLNEK